SRSEAYVFLLDGSRSTSRLLPVPQASRPGEATLGVRQSGERGSARLRESDGGESERACITRKGSRVAGFAGFRGSGLDRRVDKDEPVDDLVAVGPVVVLEP